MSTVKEWPVLKPIKAMIDKKGIELVYVFGMNGKEVLCVDTNDIVWAFGQNCDGVLGLGHNSPVTQPTIVEELCDKQIDCVLSNNYSVGHGFVLALTGSGLIYAWGSNAFGNLGNGGVNSRFNPELIAAFKELTIIDICCGRQHCLALTETGEVYAWGGNGYGECGTGDNVSPQLTPIKVRNLDGIKITAIACGGYHSLALTESGLVYGWGYNYDDQLAIGDTTCQSSPIQSTLLNVNILKVRAGFSHSLFLSSNGDVYGCGANSEGQIGAKSEDTLRLLLTKATDIEAVPQRSVSMAVSVFKRCFVWGYRSVPFEVSKISLNEVLNVVTNEKFTIKPVKLIESQITQLNFNTMFNNSDHYDVKFKIDGKYIYAQKPYLISVCEHFDRMFADNRWFESSAETIEITQYSYAVYHSFVKYLYDRIISTTESLDNLLQLLDLANAYFESDLKNKCAEIIKREISLHNVCDLYLSAVRYDCVKLVYYCLDFAADKIESVCFTDGYLNMFATDKTAAKNFRKFFIK